MNQLQSIRQAEAESHTNAYIKHELYAAGSWLAKPVKTVLDLLPMFEGYSSVRALDLGCGVGRNSIPVAQYFRNISCRVDCVDILDLAIEMLRKNSIQYGVEDVIFGEVSSIDEYSIPKNTHDLIMAVSALEHVDSEDTFQQKLWEIRDGLRVGGIACLIINAGVQEHDKDTGKELTPQFEVNLSTTELQESLSKTFTGWKLIKHTVVHQKYEIPRENVIAQLEADVVTWVVRK